MKKSVSVQSKGKTFRLIGLFFVFLLVAGAVSIHYLFRVNNELKVVLEHEVPITELIARITVHKLEQTSLFERALRHAEVALPDRQADSEDTRRLEEAKAKFGEITLRINEEIETATRMSMDAQQSAPSEEMGAELRRIEALLTALRQEYADHVTRVDELLVLFTSRQVEDAERIADEMERLDEAFNQRLEHFLFETEEITRRALSLIGEKEGTAIILLAMIVSIALLFTVAALFLNSIYELAQKVGASRHRGDGDNR